MLILTLISTILLIRHIHADTNNTAVNATLLVNETATHIVSPVFDSRVTFSSWWKLQAPNRDMNTVLHIIKFQKYSWYPCASSSLTVYDGPDTTNPRLAVFCKPLTDRQLVSSGDSMYIVAYYVSTGWQTYYSFAFSSEKVNQSCGGVLEANSTVSHLTSPGYPRNYFNNQTCEWTIQSQDESVPMAILVPAMKLQSSSTCSNDFLKIFFRNNTHSELLLTTICSSTSQFLVIWSPRNTISLRFKTDDELVNIGFNISYRTMSATSRYQYLNAYDCPSYVYSPGYPDSYQSNLICSWSISTTSVNSRIRVSVELENGFENCTSTDVLVLTYISYPDQQIAICSEGSPANSTAYAPVGSNVMVTFKSSSNESGPAFRVSYQQMPGPTTTTASTTSTTVRPNHCKDTQLTATETDRYLTSPGYPDKYLSNLYCVWHITAPQEKMIHVKVVDSELESSADCRFDIVKAFDGVTNQSSLLENWCDDRAPTFQSTGNTMLIIFRTDGSVNKKGFRLKYSATETPYVCSTNISVTASGTTIYSPMYPVTYPRHMNCFWYLTAEYDVNIKLTVLDNSFRSSHYCYLDTISINDDAGEIGTLCGSRDRTFVSSGRNMRIRFYSGSYGTTGSGFKLAARGGNYEVCESQYLKAYEYNNDDLTSPRYPLSYPNNADCKWYITTNSYGHVITLEVVVSDVQYSAGCWKDYVEAFDGQYTSSPSLGRWCGILTPTKTSSGRSMTVLLHTDQSHTGGGFKITYYSKQSSQSENESTQFNTAALFGGLAGGGFLLAILILCGRSYKKRKLTEMSQADEGTRPAYLTTPAGQLSTPSPEYTVGYSQQQVSIQPTNTGEYYNTAVFDPPPSYNEVIKTNTDCQLPSYDSVPDKSTTNNNSADSQGDGTRL
ncbi:deleted in malignant brain tumors 1 protein-like [Haliotis asinina]|uniref:deleted in malignant brain tumors 1 protein-like n=1 Tax=Haliotis asinina TaxID=109174 RepID=UPI00353207FB